MNEPRSIEDSVGLVASFLDKFGAPVEGHAREELSPEETSRIRQLAAGELEGPERDAILPLLIKNEAAIELLAQSATGGA